MKFSFFSVRGSSTSRAASESLKDTGGTEDAQVLTCSPQPLLPDRGDENVGKHTVEARTPVVVAELSEAASAFGGWSPTTGAVGACVWSELHGQHVERDARVEQDGEGTMVPVAFAADTLTTVSSANSHPAVAGASGIVPANAVQCSRSRLSAPTGGELA